MKNLFPHLVSPRFAAGVAAASLLSSCASPAPSTNSPVASVSSDLPGTANAPSAEAPQAAAPLTYAPAFKETSKNRWENGLFTVVFVAGATPKDWNTQTPPSYFSVVYTGGKKNTHTTVRSWQHAPIESGLDTIKVLSSPDPRKILISDTVPNDCCACTTGTIVTATASGRLEVSYYDLPESMEVIGEGEDAQVSDFTGDQVTCRYRQSKEVITAVFKDLKVLNHPVKPG